MVDRRGCYILFLRVTILSATYHAYGGWGVGNEVHVVCCFFDLGSVGPVLTVL